ncbi:M4 family peptidase (plasmid) [Azospirillum argentinense]|uniref:Neutral metalloproteinase n=1 Tax=Azospirillum argentinense TaxID=2970906 RepID=A0A4D8PS12_9PROT|nr:M4 family metallopeptidase [Azospirillum argentinense]QCO00111.1 M4 family peptidase [Azospirillum argentinense]
MAENGLTSFSYHIDADETGAAASLAGPAAFAGPLAASGAASLDAETAARAYLVQGLASAAMPRFAVDSEIEQDVDFRIIGTETVPLTKTQTVKFRQHFNKIPIYGSLVTVELDQQNGLVSMNSALGTPEGVDPMAQIAPANVVEKVCDTAGLNQLPAESLPRLYFYFDQTVDSWRLAYIAENVPEAPHGEADGTGAEADGAHGAPLPELFDYIVDAHSGEIVARLPRVASVEIRSAEEPDVLGRPRRITAIALDAGGLRLHDPEFNVYTHDADFADVQPFGALPGPYCVNPPAWLPAAISAHANGTEVARFVRDVLMRNGIDNRGGAYVATINCLWGVSPSREWRNAAWYRDQMIYGQRFQNGQLLSYAAALDVVAHEIFHGITDRTARLEYAGETGALNESYSDIFGIIVSNISEPNLAAWNWEMGEELTSTGIPIRDFRDPRRRNQPDHMDEFVRIPSPYHQGNDYGGVHINSGIHNKAAYNILNSQDHETYLFQPAEVTQIFYLALSQSLSRTATFADSHRAVMSAARSLFRADPKRSLKVAAVAEAFEAVGIVEAVA